MPYHIAKSSRCPTSKPYGVINTASGEVMGCHPSRPEANQQLAALYAKEPNLHSLPPMMVAKKRHIANPIADRLNPRPWRPDDA